MPNIVISYRREDTKWIVGRIFDRLEQHYGRDQVFMDIDAISYGLDYRDHIRNTLEHSDILLAVIGPQWLAAQEAGEQRISLETDWVRIEIETALGKKIPVIPVLIDRTTLPKPNELPEKVRDLAFRQAISIDTGVDFRTHMDRLVRAMDELLARQRSTPQPSAPQSKPSTPQSTSLPRSGNNADPPSPASQTSIREVKKKAQTVWIVLLGLIFGGGMLIYIIMFILSVTHRL
jgi:TIR domain